MGVPGHDERDFEFAEQFGLEIRQVVEPSDGSSAELPYLEKSPASRSVSSAEFSGLKTPEAITEITSWLADRGVGKGTIHFRLRDWCCHASATGLPDPDDPLRRLRHGAGARGRSSGAPAGGRRLRAEGPLPACRSAGLAVRCLPGLGLQARRETDTMDTFVDSSWYFLRYCDARCAELPVRREIVNYWAPINQYIGGVEHAILHLMYAGSSRR